jgi:outer membrane cobalamin receptor
MFVGKRYFMDQNIPSNEIDAYVEQGVSASRTFSFGKAHTLRLQADVVNLANRQYEVIKYYPMPGRSWRLGVVWKY